MHSISFHSHVGSDGTLRLEVPLNLKNREVEVTVIVQPITTSSTGQAHDAWGVGFLNRIAGGWQGDPLTREEQGSFEIRDELE